MQFLDFSENVHLYFLGFESNGIMFEVINATTAATIPITKGL